MVEENYESKLVSRDQDQITISIRDQVESYEIIQLFEFSSERGMMSILLKNKETSEIFSYAKGSDSAIQKRILEWEQDQQNLYKDVNTYASKGLRTLAFAFKTVNEAEINGQLEDMEADEIE